MRKQVKRFALVGCLCALATSLAFGAGNLQTAAAAGTPDLQDHGASVRKVDPTGLRFTFSVDASFKDAGYTFGTLVLPKALLGDDVLNHNDDAADEVDLPYQNIAQENWATDVYRALAEKGENQFYEEGREYFNAVMTKIPDTDYGTTLVARSYAYKDGAYYYSEPVERSIAQVAAAALQGGESGDLLVEYVDTALGENELSLGVNNAYLAVDGAQTFDLANDNDYAAIWSSSDDSVATVDNTGKVTAKKAGKATISATIGSKSVSTKVQVGAAIEGVKIVNMQSAISSGAFAKENDNATVVCSNETMIMGSSTAKITSTKSNQATGQYKVSLDLSKYLTISFKVYRPAGEGGYFLRVKSKNGSTYPQIYDGASVDKKAGEWVDVTIDVSKVTNANMKDLYIQFGTNDTTGGATATNNPNKYIYVSDIYAVEKPITQELVVSMKDAIANKAFTVANSNSGVVYTEDYQAYDSGMAKVTANANTQAYGYYVKELDVSAYSKIVFKVYRPAGEGGYYLRIKTGNAGTNIYDGWATPINAGEWVEITLDVSRIENKSLYKFYVQFGTNGTLDYTQAKGEKGKYILVSDIYGIKE